MNRKSFLKKSALGVGIIAAVPLLPIVPKVPNPLDPTVLWPVDPPLFEYIKVKVGETDYYMPVYHTEDTSPSESSESIIDFAEHDDQGWDDQEWMDE